MGGQAFCVLCVPRVLFLSLGIDITMPLRGPCTLKSAQKE